jgi:hypothetical protein
VFLPYIAYDQIGIGEAARNSSQPHSLCTQLYSINESEKQVKSKRAYLSSNRTMSYTNDDEFDIDRPDPVPIKYIDFQDGDEEKDDELEKLKDQPITVIAKPPENTVQSNSQNKFNK